MGNRVSILKNDHKPQASEPAPKTPPVKRSFYQRFMLSLIIIAVSLVINIGVYFVLARLFKVNYLFSNAWAWLAYVTFLYATRKYFYFRHTATGFKAKVREFYRFIGIRLGTGILDMILMFILVGLFSAHPMNAKIIVIVIITILNIILTNFWIFRPKPEKIEQNNP